MSRLLSLLLAKVFACLRLSALTRRKLVLRAPSGPAVVHFNREGVPTVDAPNRAAAYFALGFVSARDRLFQMELIRRSAAGTLAALLGKTCIEQDSARHRLGFPELAERLLAQLPDEQRQILDHYTAGVNAYLQRRFFLGWGFVLLRHRPEKWVAGDVVLASLELFLHLCGSDEKQRAQRVMAECLEPEVFRFLTGRSRPQQLDAALVEQLAQAQAASRAHLKPAAVLIRELATHAGSNCWAVSAKAGFAATILANDTHLTPVAPSFWYAAHLRYERFCLSGFTLPGIPIFPSGTNGTLAWGLANAMVNGIELLPLELHPDDPQRYRVEASWETFRMRSITLKVRGMSDHVYQWQETRWGPLSRRPVAGRPHVVRWLGMRPGAVRYDWIEFDRAPSVSDAMNLTSRLNGPPLTLVFADSAHNIGWTLAGDVPCTAPDPNPVASLSWQHVLQGAQRPRAYNPSRGYVMACNQPLETEHPIDADYHASARSEVLAAGLVKSSFGGDEQAHWALQNSTDCAFYAFYRDLALEAATAAGETLAVQALKAWDGKADLESRGLHLILGFRQRLLEQLYGSLLAKCTRLEADFQWVANDLDSPARLILEQRPTALIPRAADQAEFQDWSAFLVSILQKVLADRCDLACDASWSKHNRIGMPHPLGAVPLLGFFNLEPEALPGCGHSPRVATPHSGVAHRFVISPGRPAAGLWNMPLGPSEHCHRRQSRSLHRFWRLGLPLPFQASRPENHVPGRGEPVPP